MSWTEEKEKLLDEWIQQLISKHTKYYFLSERLKKDEAYLTWVTIVISTIITTFNSITAIFSNYPFWLEVLIKIVSVLIGLSMTLTIAWIKHNQFITRIADCERLLQSLEDLTGNIKAEKQMPDNHRTNADEFIKQYRETVTLVMKNNPEISPNELKEIIEKVRDKYPELAEKCGWNEDINPFVTALEES